MFSDQGWNLFNTWEHSAATRELYSRRAKLEEVEMTCHAQAAELIEPHIQPGDGLLDIGCGSGQFFHSLRRRGIDAKYYGIDAAPSLIAIGKNLMPEHGLPADRLMNIRIEDLSGTVDHTVCINVLSNIDNYQKPLERLLSVTRKSLILRESLNQNPSYRYVNDPFLDPDCNLKVYVNTYDIEEFCAFIYSYGFVPTVVTDRRTSGQPELVIGYPHYWTFVVATRIGA